MRTVNVNVGECSPGYGIIIGRKGETEATQIVFDISTLIETYGNGTCQLMAKLPGGTAYPVAVAQDGTSVIWTVSNADTSVKGSGECELFYYVGEALAKSIVWNTVIARDIGTEGDPPNPYSGWVEQVTEQVEALSDKVDGFNDYEISNPSAGEILIKGVNG